ncbi:unnamed protein product [Agarophyton chilense]|eukprot:gb/GEZJ01002800.1/.p1 GENE.gb/GEZJ01002800.1/~~gb/GEZJ01002800.1/.p1  ORF type:complete len:338 (-),score=35.16 gb/GEZJ01002800.1/:989-2002(-)
MQLLRTLVLVAACLIWKGSATSYTCALNPTIYAFDFGSLNCIAVSDGPVEVALNPFSIPDAALARSYRKNFRALNPMLLSQNVLIVDLPAGRAIFDTGSFQVSEKLPSFAPLFRNSGVLMHNLRAAGVLPSSIDFVFLTHGHPDHVAGLVTKNGKRAFPRAQVFVSLKEHEFWSNPSPSAPMSLLDADSLAAFAKLYRDTVAPYEQAGKLRTVNSEDEDESSPVEGIRFMSVFGHAPGHCAIEVKNGGERMVFIGDAWVSTADQLQNPEWSFFTETNRTKAYLSREELLTDLAKTEALVMAYHESFPGLGFVQERGPFFEWIPNALQRLGYGVQKGC